MKKLDAKLALFSLAIILLCVSDGISETINAASCSQANIQSAVNSARDGDALTIPAGNCTWSSSVELVYLIIMA